MRLLLLVSVCLVAQTNCLSTHIRSRDSIPRAAPISDAPNIVTPLLPGSYKQAQDNSRVNLPGYNATELYSGFFNIDKTTGSNTYFLFSTAISGREDAPVLLWLNGGPGASSLLGFYDELGPFGIDEQMQIVPRAVSWNKDAHLLAFDNPLGVGYSHTNSLERMATNQTTVGADLYEVQTQLHAVAQYICQLCMHPSHVCPMGRHNSMSYLQ